LKLSILMAVHNRLDLTRRCLPTLEASFAACPGLEPEIIIVDDLSTDGTRDFLAALRPPYRIVLNERQGNFAVNNNRAAALARGDLFLLLNNDTELPPDWLPPLLDALASRPDAGFIGNVQRIPATGRLDHLGVVFPPWLIPIHYGQHLRVNPFADAVLPWSAVTAACCLTTREIFFAAGTFDEAYVNGCEDIDLCLRMHRLGRRHYVANRSEILHHKGSSPGRRTHNNTNLTRLKSLWADTLRRDFVPRDARLAARSYLRGALAQPLRTNAPKLLRSLLVLAGLPRLAR
jgi:GT2 family glycosyltransferase